MKKLTALLLALMMVLSLSACGGGEQEADGTTDAPETAANTQAAEDNTQNDYNPAPEGAVTDEKKLGDAVTCKTEGDDIIFSIKTSAEINSSTGWLGLCPVGIYLTEEAADAEDFCYEYWDDEYDREWFDGIYTFEFDAEIINDIEAGTYSMVLCDDDDCGDVVGSWLFVKEAGDKFSFLFSDSWLRGAGESRNPEQFESTADEIMSWFDYKCDDEFLSVSFDGYYLDESDDNRYYMFICPEGDYSNYAEADESDLEYAGFTEKCPYVFPIEHSSVPEGRYTVVLAKEGGTAEIVFAAEKTGAAEWDFDFENAKCSAIPELPVL